MRIATALRRSVAAAATAIAATALTAGAASAATVTNRTVFATHDATGRLDRLSLNGSGAVVARTPVHLGDGARALDYFRGRLVFVKHRGEYGVDSELWIREADGRSRYLTRGSRATFTPGGTALLFARTYLAADEAHEWPRDVLGLYYLADGRVRALTGMAQDIVGSGIRFGSDGTTAYMVTDNYADMRVLQAYSLRERRFVRALAPTERDGWAYARFVELLPSGSRLVVSNFEELLTVRLSTWSVTSRKPLPAHESVMGVRGRLNGSELLASSHLRYPEVSVHVLRALDTATMTTRHLTGSTGYRDGVAAYQLP